MRKQQHRDAVLRVLREHCGHLAAADHESAGRPLWHVWDFFERYGEFIRQPAIEMLAEAAAANTDDTARARILEMRAALERFTRQRPLMTIEDLKPVPPPRPPSPVAPGNLRPGDRLRVLRAFVDFHSGPVEAGAILTFCSYDYFPHDGGFTLHFEERTLRLAEIDPVTSVVLENLEDYFEKLPPA